MVGNDRVRRRFKPEIKNIARQYLTRLIREWSVKGLIILINVLLKTKKATFWLFRYFFRVFGWVIIYRPLVLVYRGYLRFRRRLINHYQRNLWLSAAVLLAIAVAIVFSNWRESGRLVASDDLVRGTWIAKLVGDEFNQLNELVVDNQTNYQLNLNRPKNVVSRLGTLGAPTPGSIGFVGMATDRWVYGFGLASLPEVNEPAATSPAASTRGIVYYTVRIGDTLGGVARSFGVSINTVAWQNGLSINGLIRPGDKLAILPVSGVLHKVRAGDSLSKIAKQYKVDTATIVAYNRLSGDRVVIGQSIVIPGGQPPATVASQIGKTIAKNNLTPKVQQVFSNVKKTVKANLGSASSMTWPTSGHRITQYYSMRHNGVDIANRVGTPIYAAAAGRVEISAGGYNGGYGNTILLNHGKLKTRYGHLSRLYVKAGQTVVKGQVIGEMGSTGRSTGPHLHFEVLSGKVRYNPLNYIR